MENVFEKFTASVIRLGKLIQKIKVYEMREYGLKAVHVMCVYYLGESEDGLTASELVKLTYEDKAAISRAIDALEERGAVIADAKTHGSVIRLTESGKMLAAAISQKTNLAVQACNAHFNENEKEFFYGSLEKITENITKYYENLLNKD